MCDALFAMKKRVSCVSECAAINKIQKLVENKNFKKKKTRTRSRRHSARVQVAVLVSRGEHACVDGMDDLLEAFYFLRGVELVVDRLSEDGVQSLVFIF